MTKKPTNMSASVRQRLLNIARESGDPYQLVLTRYALERLLYRIGRSGHAGEFVLKGALLFSVWADAPRRSTKDLDLLGSGEPSPERVREVFREICATEVKDDGLSFDASSVKAEDIREDQVYGGIRVGVLARLGKIRIPLQVDVGFGDAVVPEAGELEYPGLLDFPRARVRAYPPEAVVAEKLHAMVVLGMVNSRMKDFYDLWALARVFSFDMRQLAGAVRATFERRGTALPAGLPVALTSRFAGDRTKAEQWGAFLHRSDLAPAPPALGDTISSISRFVGPVIEFLDSPKPRNASWFPGGPWE